MFAAVDGPPMGPGAVDEVEEGDIWDSVLFNNILIASDLDITSTELG